MKTTNKTTTLNCSHNTAGLILILIGSLFAFIGCTQLYKTIGLTDEQAADQVAKDQSDRQQIIEGIRFTTTELITTAIAGIGAIASGILAKWLGTERKITTALITGIEAVESVNVKESVQAKATAAGVETALHSRVLSLT